MPTTDQITDVVAAAAQAPVNNLIVLVLIGFVAVGLLILMLINRFVPSLVNLYKQQAETNAQLTKIVGQNSEQAKLAMASVDNNTAEMRKQTGAIEKLGADFSGYQSTASDAIEEFRADVDKQHVETKANIAEIKSDIATAMTDITAKLTNIENILRKREDCADAVAEIDEVKKDVEKLKQAEAKRATDESKLITDTPPPAELPLEGAA